MTPWESESIPDAHSLYLRIHAMWWKNGQLFPGAFKNHGRGMSTNWSRYATPQDTKNQARDPHKNAVVEMNVGAVRGVPGQVVEHTPDLERNNRAHTDVLGEKDPEVQLSLLRVAKVVIDLPQT